jgi:hypothetical protein
MSFSSQAVTSDRKEDLIGYFAFIMVVLIAIS